MTTSKPSPRPAPKKWTVENGRYVKAGKLAQERAIKATREIAKNHDGKTTHVPAEF